MELLNNIWMALSTPNELIMNIITVPANFIEAFFVFKIFTLILDVKYSKKQLFVYVILSALSGIFTTFVIPSPLNTIVNLICMFIFNFIIFRLSIIKTILAILLPTLIFALITTLIINPYITFLNITSLDLSTIPAYKIGYLAILYLIIYIVTIILKNKNYVLTILDDMDRKNKRVIVINLVLGILALLVQAFITFYYIDKLPVYITFFSFISLLAYFSISIFSMTRIIKLTQTTRKLESAEEYNKTLRILHDNVRGFKHDFDNIVTTIGGYVKTNDLEGLKKYYKQLEDDCQKVNNLYLLNPEIINNPGVYSLLTNKYNDAISKNIKVNISFLLDLNTLKMKIYEFARILGILLDNAIEASNECEEKIINIIFRDDEKNHRQLIVIENTYQDKDVDTEKIFAKGVSGKENHTGLGLWEVQNILKKNNNLSLFTTKNDKYFSQQLEIYY